MSDPAPMTTIGSGTGRELQADGITVRDGTAADIDSLRELWLQLRRHHEQLRSALSPIVDDETPWESTRAEYLRWLRAGEAIVLLAVDAAGAVCGFLVCRLTTGRQRTFDVSPRGVIDSLVVDDREHGSGIGSVLLDSCRRRLSSRGIRHWSIAVVEGDDHTEAEYERMGFRRWTRDLIGETGSVGPD